MHTCSVVVREVQHHKVGDNITMTLMKKEKGSIYAVPAHYWTKQERKCHNVDGKQQALFNPVALRKAKIVYNFGLSECNRVNIRCD